MADSPIADDYPHYRLLYGEVIKIVDWSFGPSTVVFRRPGKIPNEVADIDDLTHPTRLQLQLLGGDYSPGGLLEEDDIQKGDYIYIPMGNEIGRVSSRSSPFQISFHHGPDFEAEAKIEPEKARLATPAELLKAGIGQYSHTMDDHTVDSDYDQYRLYDGEVVWFHHKVTDNLAVVDSIGGFFCTINVDTDELTRPTRLHLQLAGDDDSPGGLLDEGDIREGDWVQTERRAIYGQPPLYVEEIRENEDTGCKYAVSHTPARTVGMAPSLNDCRLATPAELREAGIEPPESNGEQPEDDDVDVSDAANRYVATQLQIAALRRLREAVEATERDEYAHAAARATAAVGLLDDIIDREPPADTRTCPRCLGTRLTVIETVSRRRSGTIDTTGRMHCSPPEGEEVVDRRLRCDCCQYEWRREGWEVMS